MFSAKTRDTHRSSIIDWLPDRRQKWKTKLIYSCFFRGDKLDPETATQWLIINANPTYTPLFPCIPFSLPLPLCVSFTPFGSGVCCNLHLTLALLAVIVAFVAFVFWPVSAWPFSSCFHYTLCCHRSTLALLIFLPLLFELSFGGEGGGEGRSCVNTSFAIALPASEASTVAQRGV